MGSDVDTSTEAVSERCPGHLGRRPSWMSPDQWDPCPCTLAAGHEGPHRCRCGEEESNISHVLAQREADRRRELDRPADRIAALVAERDEARAELKRLQAWKDEACEVIEAWELVWSAIGEPGELGDLKSAATLAEVDRLAAERDRLAAILAAVPEDVRRCAEAVVEQGGAV